MNAQKFTQKSLEAIQNAQDLAVQNQNSQIEEEHLILALLEQEDSLIKELLNKMGVPDSFENDIRNKVENDPKMVGGARKADAKAHSPGVVEKRLKFLDEISNKLSEKYRKEENELEI